jgi:predicted MPP superfamily phosphohydrolase
MRGNWFFILITVVLFLIAEYYCYIAFVGSFKKSKKQKKIAQIAFIVFTISGWAGLYWLRYVSHHQFPQNVKAVLLALLFGFVVSKMLIAVILLIADLTRGIKWLSSKAKKVVIEDKPLDNADVPKISRGTFIARAALLAGGLTFGLFLWGTTNRYRYQIANITLRIKDLPDELKGLRIVQISDIHSGSFDNREAVARGIAMIMEQKPDIILFTGDLVNERSVEIEPYLDLFASLSAPLGVYSILGNHDYGDYVTWPSDEAKQQNMDRLYAYQKQMGWKLLRNEHVVLTKNGASFALIGVENWSENTRFPRLGKLEEASVGLEQLDLPLKILMSHDPSHWDAAVRKNAPDINLTLSGHTHGMQFGVELPFFKWSPSQYVFKQWAGLYQEGNQYLYVNRGFGFLGYQGRIGILPEITVIDLI